MKTFDEYRIMTETALTQVLPGMGTIPERLAEAMEYSLSAGGKRIRPVLLLAACEGNRRIIRFSARISPSWPETVC